MTGYWWVEDHDRFSIQVSPQWVNFTACFPEIGADLENYCEHSADYCERSAGWLLAGVDLPVKETPKFVIPRKKSKPLDLSILKRGASTYWLISTRFRDTIASVTDDARQFIRCSVQDEAGSFPSEDYFLCDAPLVLNALDLERSYVTISETPLDADFEFKTDYQICGAITLRQDAVAGKEIFRPNLGRFSAQVLVSDRLMKAISSSAMKGVALVDATSRRLPPRPFRRKV